MIDLNALDSRGFEDLMHDIYEAEGWTVDVHSGVGPDGGKDLVISKVLSDGVGSVQRKYVVQCKRYTSNVNLGHVKDTADLVRRNGATGFILAVTSDISEPLRAKLEQLTENGTACQTRRPFEIHNAVVANDSIFLKYFPAEFKEYKLLRDSLDIRATDTILGECLGTGLTADEIGRIHRLLITTGVETPGELRALLTNKELTATIDSTHLRLLKRSPSPLEVVYSAIELQGCPVDQRDSVLGFNLSNSDEFLSRVRGMCQ